MEELYNIGQKVAQAREPPEKPADAQDGTGAMDPEIAKLLQGAHDARESLSS